MAAGAVAAEPVVPFIAEQVRIAEAIAKKRGRLEVLEEWLDATHSRSQSGRPNHRRSSRGTGGLKDGSQIARAYGFLSKAGESKHVRDILSGIGDADTPNKRNALASQINRYAQVGRYFVRDETKGRRFFMAVVVDGEPDEPPE